MVSEFAFDFDFDIWFDIFFCKMWTNTTDGLTWRVVCYSFASENYKQSQKSKKFKIGEGVP